MCGVSASMWCAFLLLLPLALGQRSRDELLNWCLDAKNHKSKPGPEDVLFNQCSPWREKSCCTPQTTKDLHLTKMYNMNYNHCPKPDGSDLSAKCFRHFIQDHCFYECEPNIGPWVNKTDRKMAEERFTNVPLCQSDCQSWFEACKDDYTCVDNWPKKLNFKNTTKYFVILM
ncbi:FOLR1 [Cordylochernes scorpioides]|uniref:FOLR1 n=1 Tax=Cordylochernes scorpioides TaxID=51811 RepID=A0ABY6K6G0_9ARAC|nr:FOLR1 [Cordylochernes scorpioides]